MQASSASSSNLHLYKTVGDPDGRVIQCDCTDPGYTVLILARSSTVLLSGAFSFQVLYGAMRVNGFLFQPSRFNTSNFVNVSIPQGHFPASFSICDDLSAELHTDRIQSRLREFVNDPRKIFPFAEERKPIAILLIRMEMDIVTRFVRQQTLSIVNLFPRVGKQLGRNLYCLNIQQEGEGTQSCCWSEANTQCLKMLEDDYRQSLAKIYRVIEREDCCIMAVIGNKGVGKSTACRYLINSLNTGTINQPAKRVCRVFLLDLDVGQSEFSPSGCISLYEPKKPMIGAPFAFQETALPNSYFFGSNNIGVNFALYDELVSILVQQFKSCMQESGVSTEKCVLIVNTAGWIEDLGYDLMLRVIRILNPSVMMCLERPGITNFEIPACYTKITARIKSNRIEHPQLNPVGQPAFLRSLLVAGYLAQTFHNVKNIKIPVGADLRLAADAPTYRLPFRCAAIYFHPELRLIKDKFVLNALNCAFVALCRVEEKNLKCFKRSHLLDDESLPARLVFCPQQDDGTSVEDGSEIPPQDDIVLINADGNKKQFPILRCIGFGLIRAINPERKLFYIITPIEQRYLGQVDVLALGHCLNTPELIFDTNSYEAVPYLIELRENAAFGDHQKKLFSPLRVVTGTKRFLPHRTALTNAHGNKANEHLIKKARFN